MGEVLARGESKRLAAVAVLLVLGVLLLGYWVLMPGVQLRTVKTGDTIFVDYTGSLVDGKVFDTSIESVAKENNLFTSGREYKPLKLTVGKGVVIKGFDESVIGMKVGESKIVTIPQEKGYGSIDPKLISVIPITEKVPAGDTFPKSFEMPRMSFESMFGAGHEKGEVVKMPNTGINLTIQNIDNNVLLAYNLNVGDKISMPDGSWNEIVVRIDDKYITIMHDVKENDIIQIPGSPWKTTVIEANSKSITVRHNSIPDTVIPAASGGIIRVHFNETSIIMDQNHELAGKTLIFEITLRSIEK